MSICKKINENDSNLHFYRKYKYDQDSEDPINVLFAKRMHILLNQQSIKNEEENAAIYLLEKSVNHYSDTIDDKNGLNNFAQYVQAVSSFACNTHTDYKRWTSSLIPLPTNSINSENYSKDENLRQYFLNLKKNLEYRSQKQPESDYISNKRTLQTSESLNCISTKESTNFPGCNLNRKVERVEERNFNEPTTGFRTAKSELKLQNIKKYGQKYCDSVQQKENPILKRSLGGRGRSVHNKFIPPIKHEELEKETDHITESEVYEDERLKNLDPKMIELIKNEIMDHGKPISWDDIAGLQFAKTTIQEIVVWPLLRPDIFTGLRRPPKGILLFGPPGTGKTLIGKCIASQSCSTFFSISASSLTSKWIGESEKLVRTLFAVARCHQPAVIFIDEIDSLLSQRSETEHESSRRIKTEFLVQLDGATTHEDDRILVIGATNRPQELDEAARRRLVKRLYIPLPEFEARSEIVRRLMRTEKNDLTETDINEIAKLTDGYSGADMKNLCQEASLGPIRSIALSQIGSIESHQVRPVTLTDFISALKHVKSSVSPSDLLQYLEWDKVYGSSGN